MAVRLGHVDVIRVLLKSRGIEVNKGNREGVTAVFAAAQEGKDQELQLLITAQANVTIPRNDGQTPIGIAASRGHSLVVRELCGKGANPHAPTPFGTALDQATRNAQQIEAFSIYLNLIKLLKQCVKDAYNSYRSCIDDLVFGVYLFGSPSQKPKPRKDAEALIESVNKATDLQQLCVALAEYYENPQTGYGASSFHTEFAKGVAETPELQEFFGISNKGEFFPPGFRGNPKARKILFEKFQNVFQLHAQIAGSSASTAAAAGSSASVRLQ
jgi:hypothetical protein